MNEVTITAHPTPDAAAPETLPVLEVRELSVEAAGREILRKISLRVLPRTLVAIVGPSGAGKSTFLRCLNRLTDLTPELRLSGEILLQGRSIFDPTLDPNELRAHIGMLFQQPVVFPRSILDNTLFGVRHLGRLRRQEQLRVAEAALREAALWDEVAGRLGEPATMLSVGQQQRLSLARALAVEPEVLLMDEPTSALDPAATAAIEGLMERLKRSRALVLVTHDVDQARRLGDQIVAIRRRNGAGEMAEVDDWDAVYEVATGTGE